MSAGVPVCAHTCVYLYSFLCVFFFFPSLFHALLLDRNNFIYAYVTNFAYLFLCARPYLSLKKKKTTTFPEVL